jgi:hypothetical protein
MNFALTVSDHKISSMKQSNTQDLIKLVALFAMFIDHIGMFFLESDFYLRAIGRTAMPIFCFFAGYNLSKLNLKVLWGGLLTLAIKIFCSGSLYINILLGIFISEILVLKIGSNKWLSISIFICAGVLTFYGNVSNVFEYGLLAFCFILCGNMANKKQDFSSLLVISLALLFIFNLLQFRFNELLFFGVMVEFFACYHLLHLNMEKTSSIKLALVSRYILPIYVIHFNGFVLLKFTLLKAAGSS